MDKQKESWKWNENGVDVIRSVARSGPGCHEGCGVLLYVKDGKLIKVEGDPDHPFNHGRLCPRCLALPQVVYHPDRLKYPMKRAGARGEGKWKRITWEEAFDTVYNKFTAFKKEYGPESVLFCMGTGRDIGPYIGRLAVSFGSPNMLSFGPLHGHACYLPRVFITAATAGELFVTDCSQFFPDRYENTGWKAPACVVVWGNNPIVSNADGFMGYWLVECMKQGTELIVIDPKRTWLATRARHWLQIRPGTDGALALGMLNIIINEKLYDKTFVEKWTHGFEALINRVQDYPPDKVSAITGIPEDIIIKAARMYGMTKPAAIQWGVAVDQTKECAPAIHAIIALCTITGNLDVPGGNIFRSRAFGMSEIETAGKHLPKELMDKMIGVEGYPFLKWASWYRGEALIDQILSDKPYPIKASWIQTTNTFVCGAADARRTYKAFKKLEFNVVADIFMTPSAMAFADIVLPVTTYPERDGIGVAGGTTTSVGTINKAIAPLGECKSNMEINLEMGRRFNPHAWPYQNVRELFDDMLQPTGMTFEELRDRGYAYDAFEYGKHEKGFLRPDKRPGFNTPTGKVELYSTLFDQFGMDPLPYYEEPPESPLNSDIAKDYPLILTTGARTYGFFCSEHRQIPSLRQLNPDPITEVHPDIAKKYGIKDGDWIYIENRYGRCKQIARLVSGILPGVVQSQHGWWFPEMPGAEPSLFGAWESNVNLLLPGGFTGRSGFGYPFKAQMCRIYKAEGEDLNA